MDEIPARLDFASRRCGNNAQRRIDYESCKGSMKADKAACEGPIALLVGFSMVTEHAATFI